MILSLETSTKNCSVAILKDSQVLALIEEHSDNYIHSEKLHLFIAAALKEVGISAQDLTAIAVGAGPGSYTGLRIGVASAKALAYSLKIPLISALGTELLVQKVLQDVKLPANALVHPMIDARRMEVYTAAYDLSLGLWTEVEAKVITEGLYEDERPHYFLGDGAEKCMPLLQLQNHNFVDIPFPSAGSFELLAFDKLSNGSIEDVAYFEPFYLKQFQAIKAKSAF